MIFIVKDLLLNRENYIFKKPKWRKHNLIYHVYGWFYFTDNDHKIFLYISKKNH